MAGVGGGGDCAGEDDGGDVGDEDLGGFEEACWEAEESSHTGGCGGDEVLEVSVEVEGDEGEGWNGKD